MLRIEADHPTGFCLGADEVAEIMRDKDDAVFEGAFDGDHLVAYTAVMPSPLTERGQRFTLFGDVDPGATGGGTRHPDARPLGGPRAGHPRRGRVRRTDPDRRRRPGGPGGPGGAAAVGRLRAGPPQLPDAGRAPRRVPGPALPVGVSGRAVRPGDVRRAARTHSTRRSRTTRSSSRSGRTSGGCSWSPRRTPATHCRSWPATPSGSVAAFVFAHEYAVPPSGGAGPEIHVPYVGTLHRHRGRGLATALLSRVLHLSRARAT